MKELKRLVRTVKDGDNFKTEVLGFGHLVADIIVLQRHETKKVDGCIDTVAIGDPLLLRCATPDEWVEESRNYPEHTFMERRGSYKLLTGDIVDERPGEGSGYAGAGMFFLGDGEVKAYDVRLPVETEIEREVLLGALGAFRGTCEPGSEQGAAADKLFAWLRGTRA